MGTLSGRRESSARRGGVPEEISALANSLATVDLELSNHLRSADGALANWTNSSAREKGVVLCCRPMPSDIRAQFRIAFEKARDEYIAAIKAHANALAVALGADSDDVDREYERASTDLMRKQWAYHQAAENLREIGSRRE